MRVARAWHDWQGARFARFGDNMRQVAVTEGDKVAAEIAFGFSVNGYGVGDLAAESPRWRRGAIAGSALNTRSATRWPPSCAGAGPHGSLREGARIELGLRAFLKAGDSRASRPPSRTSTACGSCRAWPSSG